MKKETTPTGIAPAEDAPTEPGPSRYETLMGGKLVTVELLHHEQKEVTQEEVRIRQFPVKDYETAFRDNANETAMAALYAGKDAAWVGRLAPASYTLLVTEGRRLNADFFGYCDRQFEAQVATARRVDPAFVETIRKSAVRSLV